MEIIAFYTFAVIALGAAAGVVLFPNVLHSALMLGLSLAAVAGLFAVLGADFLFGAQLLIYVTGIAVLVAFVVMLAGRQNPLHLRQINKQWAPAAAIVLTTFWGLWRCGELHRETRIATDPEPMTHALGALLMGDLTVPFELISVILVVALVGAVLFSKRRSA
ncbi:MAG: hypothetical protein A2X36_15305 [Elusimicrobia bacterium GWA2_69_24]|nr:MAG: hypothetical protein A2X36_15305 [Elusimicrobia bacterium GWA2_69_24]HBL18086.1 NADH-quinone oxidoreductase subunit J [Elusimicrobiota bacterium]